MGANGCGKTTLLKILAGVLADYDGTVTIAGHRPGHQSKALASFLPDASFLDSDLTATRAVDLFARLFADFDPAKATHLISDVEPIIDSVVFIKDGRLLLAGDADDLRQAHGMSLDALFRNEYR